nr:MAG TPA: hypothetical protein [Caudoviricetes sp.]
MQSIRAGNRRNAVRLRTHFIGFLRQFRFQRRDISPGCRGDMTGFLLTGRCGINLHCGNACER